MSDIAGRLRRYANTEFPTHAGGMSYYARLPISDGLLEAADEIERLAAEAVRLRDALELAINVLDHHRHHYDADYFRSQKESTP